MCELCEVAGIWICECGFVVNTGESCRECGATTPPEPTDPCRSADLAAWLLEDHL